MIRSSFPSFRRLLLQNVSPSASSKIGMYNWFTSQPYPLESPNPTYSDEEYADVDWDSLGFGLMATDYMYITKCCEGQHFEEGQLSRYGNIKLSPAAGVLNYGQGLFEGTKAYRKENGRVLLFRPEQNAIRMKIGAERMCMASPSIEHFVHALKQTVLANKRWIPPPGKGSLYLRPLLLGTGPVLGLAPAPEYTFLIYASPVRNYFKEGSAPLNLHVEENFDRASRRGTGNVKTISNYAPVLMAQTTAKKRGFSDVLYLDSATKKNLEEVSSCNIFIAKGKCIATPATNGTILSGITRKSVIEIAGDLGYQVEERAVGVDELIEADEVFCTGTAVGVAPVGSITYQDKRQKVHFRCKVTLSSQSNNITMGRAPCCDKANVKKGPWSPEEDAKLKSYIEQHGTGGNWIALPQKIGLKRCGKSCRLRWLNYLRPNIKHGGFSEEEDNIICSLYVSIGSRWSVIAAQLPGRTDNDIKNYWNTRLKKKLLGKQRKELQARSKENGVVKQENNSSLLLQENIVQQQPCWPQIPAPPLSPYTSQNPSFNDQDSIRKLLIKLGGRFSDDYQPIGVNVQFPQGSLTSTQQIQEEQVHVSSSGCMNSIGNSQVQFGQSNEYCSELVQGEVSFSSAAIGEMVSTNDYSQRLLGGLEFLYGEEMISDKIMGGCASSCCGQSTNWDETSSLIYPPLVASSFEGVREEMPRENAFQELSYP